MTRLSVWRWAWPITESLRLLRKQCIGRDPCLAAAIFALWGPTVMAASIPVTTSAASGPGSLRTAIETANQDPTPDAITFRIPGGGPHTIAPQRASLPTITAPLIIDGYSQTGSKLATADSPAVLNVVIDLTAVSEGLSIATNLSTIQGLAFVGADETAVHLVGDGNTVRGNHFGTIDGTTAVDLDSAVDIEGNGNRIGGPDPSDRNVMAITQKGIKLFSGSGTEIRGNRIGTTADGTAALGTCHDGILQEYEASSANIVGNLISGCAAGVKLKGNANTLHANWIGTNLMGTVAIPNQVGVNLESDDNRIGGSAPGQGNLISGNALSAIDFESGLTPPSGNTVEGNLIGTDASGTAPLPNDSAGFALGAIAIWRGDFNTIGGTTPGTTNVISGNLADGVVIGTGTTENRVLGNRIGTDRAGLRPIPNGDDGVEISGDRHWVGDGSGQNARNVIAYNGGDGVNVPAGNGNAILENAIFANGGLGIDLGPDGVTLDDRAPDADAGANGFQNAGSISAAVGRPGSTSITYRLETSGNTDVRIDVFWIASCDPTGFGEGFVHLGTMIDRTGPGGILNRQFNSRPLPLDSQVTTTVTRMIAGVPSATSEFSECKAVTAGT